MLFASREASPYPPEHAALCAAVTHALAGQLKGPCRTFSEALRVRMPTEKVAYPDALVICGDVVRDPDDKNTVTNPTLISPRSP